MDIEQKQKLDFYFLFLFKLTGDDLFVADAPGTPEGPIDYKDMMGDSLTLTWKPPKDDGGSDITNCIVEKRVAGTSK